MCMILNYGTQTKVCEGTLHCGKILYTFQYIQLDI